MKVCLFGSPPERCFSKCLEQRVNGLYVWGIIGCFSRTFCRPKYMLLVLGIPTCFTCSELEVALIGLSFVSYVIVPSPPGSQLPGPVKPQAVARDSPLAGSLPLADLGFDMTSLELPFL